MTEQEEFEFRLRYEREKAGEQAGSPAPKKAPSIEDQFKQGFKNLGNVAAGAVRGAGSIGSTILEVRDFVEQKLADAMGAKGYVAGNPNRRQEMTAGLQTLGADTNSLNFALGKMGGEIAGTAGVGPALGAATKGAPALSNALTTYGGAGSLPLRVAGGAIAGGASAGLADPSAAGAGALIGGGLPVVGSMISAPYNFAKNKLQGLTDLVAPGGAERILNRFTIKKVGAGNMPAVLAAAKNADELIAGGKPTLGDVMANIPEGSPLIALEKITAKTAGGPSAAFGARRAEQQAAITAAEEARNAVTMPMKDAAISGALGGVKAKPVLDQIDQIATTPGYRASDVVTKSLGAIRDKLESLGGVSGTLHPEDLYTVRKEIGSTIQKFATENANWDKGLTAKLERQLQLGIDDAIEKAGGAGWKDYLAEYAKRSKAIDAYKARLDLAKNPLQVTNLQGGLNIGDETRTHLPNMLSRPMMVVNAIGKALGRNIETQIDAAAALRSLEPAEFVKAFSTIPPEQRAGVLALWQASRGPAITGAALATQQ